MSTRLHKLVLESGEDSLHARVWRGTPWIADAWVGDWQRESREAEMLEWCADTFGVEAFPFGPQPRTGRWRRGGATVFGWAWFGFDTEEAMNQFIAAWPTPAEVAPPPKAIEEGEK